MKINDTHWHDCVIERVIEDTKHAVISFEISCPDEADYKDCGTIIIFQDVLDYAIHEGPFVGSPTILDVVIQKEDKGERKAIRIETNASYRSLKCRSIDWK